MSEERFPPVLVVDDNHDNAEIIQQYLGARGYPVTVAYSGDEALTQFERVRPALVLLDVMSDKRTALQTGADDYVEKPFDLSRLAATVRRNVAMLPAGV
jgi:CheY-like chemotaxis protein